MELPDKPARFSFMSLPLLFLYVFAWFLPKMEVAKPVAALVTEVAEESLYEAADLAKEELGFKAWDQSLKRVERSNEKAHVLAIADMSQPSTAKRLYVIDLERKVLLLRTYVAHGQNTGELMAERFSNTHGSHQTSLGLYRVGAEIVSPKHGPALLLHGLDKGVNDQALAREVIIHGADYVSESFIDKHGRLGRSWGCPAVTRESMKSMIDLLANGGLLYIYRS